MWAAATKCEVGGVGGEATKCEVGIGVDVLESQTNVGDEREVSGVV